MATYHSPNHPHPLVLVEMSGKQWWCDGGAIFGHCLSGLTQANALAGLSAMFSTKQYHCTTCPTPGYDLCYLCWAVPKFPPDLDLKEYWGMGKEQVADFIRSGKWAPDVLDQLGIPQPDFSQLSEIETQFMEAFDTMNTLEGMFKNLDKIIDKNEVAGMLIDNLKMPYADQLKTALKECGGNPISALAEMPPEELNQMLKKLDMLESMVPGFGYMKAGVHLALGDKDAAVESLLAANECLGNYAKAAAVSVSGPAGAIAVDVAVDMLNTAIASAIYGEFRPQGSVKMGADLYDMVQQGNNTKLAGAFLDMFGRSAVEAVAGDNELSQQIGAFLVDSANAALSFAAGDKDEGKKKLIASFAPLTGAFHSLAGDAGAGVMQALEEQLGSDVATGLGLDKAVEYGVDMASSAMETAIVSAVEGKYSPQGSVNDLQDFTSMSQADKASLAVNLLKSKFGDGIFDDVDVDTSGMPSIDFDALAAKGKAAAIDKLRETEPVEMLTNLLMGPQFEDHSMPKKTRKIQLRSKANGKFICVDTNKNVLIANRDAAAGWETFDMTKHGNSGDVISLRAMKNGLVVTADKSGTAPLTASRPAVAGWEKFQLIMHASGDISLRALSNGKFVCANQAGREPLINDRPAADVWEMFSLIYV